MGFLTILCGVARLFLFCMACMGAVFVSPAQANVLLGGTRVIYYGSEKEVTLRVTNDGASASLVQVWFDSNDPKSTPETGIAPFIAMPPIFRLDPARSQTVRILFLQEALPEDRESVFWFNVLDVPPMPARLPDESSYIQMAVRSRIKLFYRPQGVEGAVEDAVSRVQWQLLSMSSGVVLRAVNPSAYHISLSSLRLYHENGQVVQLDPAMLTPRSTHDFRVDSPVFTQAKSVKLEFDAINDYGGADSYRVNL